MEEDREADVFKESQQKTNDSPDDEEMLKVSSSEDSADSEPLASMIKGKQKIKKLKRKSKKHSKNIKHENKHNMTDEKDSESINCMIAKTDEETKAQFQEEEESVDIREIEHTSLNSTIDDDMIDVEVKEIVKDSEETEKETSNEDKGISSVSDCEEATEEKSDNSSRDEIHSSETEIESEKFNGINHIETACPSEEKEVEEPKNHGDEGNKLDINEPEDRMKKLSEKEDKFQENSEGDKEDTFTHHNHNNEICKIIVENGSKTGDTDSIDRNVMVIAEEFEGKCESEMNGTVVSMESALENGFVMNIQGEKPDLKNLTNVNSIIERSNGVEMNNDKVETVQVQDSKTVAMSDPDVEDSEVVAPGNVEVNDSSPVVIDVEMDDSKTVVTIDLKEDDSNIVASGGEVDDHKIVSSPYVEMDDSEMVAAADVEVAEGKAVASSDADIKDSKTGYELTNGAHELSQEETESVEENFLPNGCNSSEQVQNKDHDMVTIPRCSLPDEKFRTAMNSQEIETVSTSEDKDSRFEEPAPHVSVDSDDSSPVLMVDYSQLSGRRSIRNYQTGEVPQPGTSTRCDTPYPYKTITPKRGGLFYSPDAAKSEPSKFEGWMLHKKVLQKFETKNALNVDESEKKSWNFLRGNPEQALTKSESDKNLFQKWGSSKSIVDTPPGAESRKKSWSPLPLFRKRRSDSLTDSEDNCTVPEKRPKGLESSSTSGSLLGLISSPFLYIKEKTKLSHQEPKTEIQDTDVKEPESASTSTCESSGSVEKTVSNKSNGCVVM